MTDLFKQLQTEAAAQIQAEYGIEVPAETFNIQETKKEFEGDFTIVVFPLTRYKIGAPPQIGETLGKALVENVAYIQSYNVIKGFLNLVLTEAYWLEFLATSSRDEAYTRTTLGKGEIVTVEYCSPNTNKPLHLGHLRNMLLGYSITEVLKANGFQVHPVCLFNDRGVQICKSMYAWQELGHGSTPESEGVKGDLFVGNYYVEYSKLHSKEVADLMEKGMGKDEATKVAPSTQAVNEMLVKWENGDPEIRNLWKQMNEYVYASYKKTFARLGVEFEKFYYESDIYHLGKDSVMKGKDAGIFFGKDDGSVWVDLSEEGYDQKLLLRSNGTSVYITQDIAGAEVRFDDFGMNRSIYVVGSEQEYHFNVLFEILKKLKKPFAEGLYHLSYGFVDLPEGKMKSREGTTVDADDLMDELKDTAQDLTQQLGKTEGMNDEELEALYDTLGLSALKYFLLKVDPRKRILFNPKESVDIQGHTGPFIQYAYTRTAAIKRKAGEVATFSADNKPEQALHEHERLLLRRLFNYPQVLKESANSYNPALIANYVFELAKDYNRFYHGDKIIQTAHPHTSAFRFTLSSFTGEILKEGMRILGIQMPERM